MHSKVSYQIRQCYEVMFILLLQVVEDASSYVGLPTIEITEHIGRNHMDMCRFTGSNDFEYRKVAHALRRMTSAIFKQPIIEKTSSVSKEQTRLLLESLRFDQINARQMTIKKAHVKTCKWLFTKPEYLDWLDHAKLREHHGFLWIKGKPGTGKSTLMKSLLANTRKSMKDKVIISFFFNARGEDLEKSTLGTYRSLLLQLLERLPTLESVFETLDLSIRTNDTAWQWSEDLLKTLLEEAILRLENTSVVCFIDALDECDERQIRDMISFFERVGELTASVKISFQVCFSSRHYPHITIESGITLTLEGQEGHTQDITSYLESELKIGHSKVAKEVRGQIQEKASGVFLWVVLVVEILNKEHDSGRIPALRRRLREIPGDLHELFNDILTRDSRNRDELILCVQWVLFARQPLTPEQLYFAITSGSEPQDLSIWDREEISIADIRRFVLNASKGLAETTSSKRPKVEFIHESVKDFLVKENGLGRIWSDLGSNFEGQSHERLKECCVNYLNIDVAGYLGINNDLPKTSSKEAVELRNSVHSALPFLEYATHHVLYHADMAQSCGVVQESFIKEFQLTQWIWLNNLLEKHQIRRHTPKASLLYLLAEYDMFNLIKIHPSISSLFEAEDERYGCPLLASLATGSERAVQSFLQACAASQPLGGQLQQLCQQFTQDGGKSEKIGRNFQFPKHGNVFSCIVDLRDKTLLGLAYEMIDFSLVTKGMQGRSLLSVVAAVGHESLAKQLLDDNAKVDSKDDKGRTPLMLATESGHEAIVTMLLESEAMIEQKDNVGMMSLMLAALNGHEAIVAILLENKASIDSQNENGETPLMLAAANGHEAIVAILLENKASIDSQNENGETPLMLAAANGHEAVVKLLLENNAVTELKSSSQKTPLILAAAKRHEAVVKMLLKHKADINSKDIDQRTSLIHATRLGYMNIVKLLLDTENVEVDSRDDIGDTALSVAVQNGHDDIVKLLLETEKVDVNNKDRKGDTPLMIAVRGGSAIMIKLLLDTGKVDVNSKNHDDDTAFSIAVRLRNNHIVKLLLETNKIDMNYKNQNGDTPLMLAIRRGDIMITKLLLDTGSLDANSRNDRGHTSLFVAAECGRDHIVQLLLNIKTIDVDSRSHDGNTPLSVAALSANYGTVNLLLHTGKVDVNSRDRNGETPLMKAARNSYWSSLHEMTYQHKITIKLLLSTGKVNIYAENNSGQTAQMIAAAKGYSSVVQMLKNYDESQTLAD